LVVGLRRHLSDLLHVEVDVVPAATLKPTVTDAVLADAITL
jgi:predicted nucleotidyltransferase